MMFVASLAAALIVLSAGALLYSSSLMEARFDGRRTWLDAHPPRKASEDYEILRRRRLAALTELAPAEVERYLPAVVASLDRDDGEVRRLAVLVLERMADEPATLDAHGAELTALLGRSADARVRLSVARTLSKLGAPLIAAAAALVSRLEDSDAEVRAAAVAALGALPAETLATHTHAAVELLSRAGDAEASAAAIDGWADKLSGRPEGDELGGLQFSLGRMGREWGDGGVGDGVP
ncbi:hypothetical protein EMIHUDRAFT_203984 [Emiliania huxleyi CCMP1516]|uniref:HEAT repeat domain-containing protein n=2 Tax=Emiliania huxleyi TaxID=2903 RepID=A0A0D3K0R8_EMIH1|nr:hypothetical protein EMIHUDRAFT_203984 [Emiliania huxleyi CCMP1516]EOD29353.1 hypothetical protein EMIHUDRAFT_203984 [Emiliania huxleyi CCMP1516]|eukprot:XP_005781782.1 hypothetical protein EMIHUDRAFT_203984 [Emiliania huxleyi CCMP1516]